MIPKEITGKDIEKAMDYIRINNYPPMRKSKSWDLFYEGENFPPKYVISKAAAYSTYGRFLFHNQFNAVEAKDRLTKLGFTIVRKDSNENVIVVDDLIPKIKQPKIKDLKTALKKLNTA